MNKKSIITKMTVLILTFSIFLYGCEQQQLPKEPITSTERIDWAPKIKLDNFYWDDEGNPSLDTEDAENAIKYANSICSQRLGMDFFNNFVRLHFPTSTISSDNSIYYLDYSIIIPEKGIDYRTTTHPTSFEINIKKNRDGFEIIKDECDIQESIFQKDFISRNEALQIAKGEIEKDISLPEEVIVDFKLKPEWVVRYDLPQEKTPQCEFKMGAQVLLKINAISKEVGKKIDCNFPGT